ncbi:hypothetical protein G6F31_017953 [Rhizopus arrhizus]|nr:hypothetical protein G6F31_017953 [Rhizopus arrhizus]
MACCSADPAVGGRAAGGAGIADRRRCAVAGRARTGRGRGSGRAACRCGVAVEGAGSGQAAGLARPSPALAPDRSLDPAWPGGWARPGGDAGVGPACGRTAAHRAGNGRRPGVPHRGGARGVGGHGPGLAVAAGRAHRRRSLAGHR